jgi:hypothetical protein
MMDMLMLALGFGLFALAICDTYACERVENESTSVQCNNR